MILFPVHNVSNRRGPPPWTPGSITSATPLFWWEAALPNSTEVSGGHACRLNNFVSGRDDVLYASEFSGTTLKPTYSASDADFGSHPSISFASGDGLRSFYDYLTGKASLTFFLLIKLNTQSTQSYLATFGAWSGGRCASIRGTNGLHYTMGIDAVSGTMQRSFTQDLTLAATRLAWQYDASAGGYSQNPYVGSNGTSEVLSNVNNGVVPFTFYRELGVGSNRGNGGDAIDGKIAAIGLFEGQMSTDDMALVDSWLQTYGANTWSRPSGSPLRIVWSGQSNAYGLFGAATADTSDILGYYGPFTSPSISAYRSHCISGTLPYTTESWQSMRVRAPAYAANTGRPCADLVACYRLAWLYGRPVEYIESARGNTSLAVDWAPSTGTDYNQLVSTYATAIGSNPSPLSSPTPVLVWIHGEKDASNTTNANNYGANLVAFYSALKTDLSAPNLKIVVVRLSNLLSDPSILPADLATIRAAQAAFVAADTANRALVDIDGLGLMPDNVHWLESTAIEAGKRIEAAIRGIT